MRVVVTGGAGYIGSAICTGLAREGASVLCLSSKLSAVCGITSIVCNLDDEENLRGHLETFGPFDGLVHCAGRAPRGGGLDVTLEEFEAALRSTAGIAFRCVKAAAANMLRGGSIVILASMWGRIAPSPEIYGGMGNGPSCGGAAGAGAIGSMLRLLTEPLAGKGIRINAIEPGWFPRPRGEPNPEYMARVESRVPLGRIGKPEELVGPAMFLLSNASSYVTGHLLTVDGGYSVR